MELIGTLKAKFDTQKVSDKFSKREFVLTTEASTPYPQFISMQVTQDKCNLLDQFSEGQELKVQFNLRGREWNSPNGIKYFNTIDVWRVEAISSSSQSSNPQSSNHAITPDNDDLPF